MTEHDGPQRDIAPSQPSRLELLRRELPSGLLIQITEHGLTQDYSNVFTGPLTYAEALIQPATGPSLKAAAKNQFREFLSDIRTYSEYWKDRIAQYNAHTQEKGLEPVSPERAFELLVTTQPGAEELDDIARRARELSRLVENVEKLAKPFIRLCAEAMVVIYPENGPRRAREVLERNGIEPEQPDAT